MRSTEQLRWNTRFHVGRVKSVKLDSRIYFRGSLHHCTFSGKHCCEWRCPQLPVVRSKSRHYAEDGDLKEDEQIGDENCNVDVELFEVAGTPQDRSSFEPFSENFKKILETVDFSEPISFDGEQKTEYDPLRDGPLRYLGYANEVGEAFAAWLFPGGVTLSYAIAIGYVFFDTADKYKKTLKDAETKLSTRSLPEDVNIERLVATIGAERGIDTLIWQLIASVGAPGYTIHTIVALITTALLSIEDRSNIDQFVSASTMFQGIPSMDILSTVNKTIPTLAGLAVIPFIVHPIDAAVHALLNVTLRPFLRSFVCNKAGGHSAGLVICKNCKEQ